MHYDACPVCNSPEITPVLDAIDHTVSKEVFSVWECADCTHRFTQDVPEENAIGAYYKAEAYISHTDSKEGLINKIYHKVRAHTLNTKKSLIIKNTRSSTKKLLDIGAGTGAFLKTMSAAGWQVEGIEPDEDARKIAGDKYKLSLQPNEALPKLTETYDAITLWHVLEHVHDLHGYFAHFNKYLLENGRLYIAVPNYQSKDAQHYKENWAAYDVPRHLYHFSPASMKKLVSMHNMEIEAMQPMWYDSFYVSMLSEQIKSGKGNVPKAFILGLLSNLKAFKNVETCSSIIYVIKKR